MKKEDVAVMLGASVIRRLSTFALSGLVVCAATYAACLAAFDGDRLSAAIIAIGGIIMFGSLMGVAPFVLLLARSDASVVSEPITPRSRYLLALHLITTAMMMGLLALVLGTGFVMVSILSDTGGRPIPGALFVVVFSAALLVFIVKFAKWGYDLHASDSVPVALMVAVCLALLGFAADPFQLSIAVAVIGAVPLTAILLTRNVGTSPPV